MWREKERSRSEWSWMHPVALKLDSKMISCLKCSLVQRKRKDRGGARSIQFLARLVVLSVWAFFSSKSLSSFAIFQLCQISTTGWLYGNCVQWSWSREKCYLGVINYHDYMDFLLSFQCSDQYLWRNVSMKAQQNWRQMTGLGLQPFTKWKFNCFVIHISLYAQIENKEKYKLNKV